MRMANIPIHSIKEYVSLLIQGGETLEQRFIMVQNHMKDIKNNIPYITVESGALSDTQKEELIKELTKISSEIMKIPQNFFVTTIKEVPDINFGIGGKTIDKVKAEYIQAHSK